MIRYGVLAAVLCLTATAAHAADWTMEAGAGRLEFSASFEGNPAPGTFKEFDPRMRFDGDTPAGGRLDVVIAVKSADMNNDDVNKAIGGPDWFDFARYPRAEFHSTDIRSAGGSRYVARGTLLLKGVQQPVEVPFAWTGSGATARMEGELVAQRAVFHIGTGQWAATNVIGPDVKIRFNVRMRKSG
jgi:polyisoprenoid-binding protein YceI